VYSVDGSRNLQTKSVKENNGQRKLPRIFGKEDAIHLLLKCPQKTLCKRELLCKIWLNMNEKLGQV
jgi:hypothetical protein